MSSTRPAQKPSIGPPIDLIATVPVKVMRSPQLKPAPYFCLIGHNSVLALSRLVLSAHACHSPHTTTTSPQCTATHHDTPHAHTHQFWQEPLSTAITATTTVRFTIGARTVPRLAHEKRPVVAVVRRPERLGLRQRHDDVLLHRRPVQRRCRSRVVLRADGGGLIGPPLATTARADTVRSRPSDARRRTAGQSSTTTVANTTTVQVRKRTRRQTHRQRGQHAQCRGNKNHVSSHSCVCVVCGEETCLKNRENQHDRKYFRFKLRVTSQRSAMRKQHETCERLVQR